CAKPACQVRRKMDWQRAHADRRRATLARWRAKQAERRRQRGAYLVAPGAGGFAGRAGERARSARPPRGAVRAHLTPAQNMALRRYADARRMSLSRAVVEALIERGIVPPEERPGHAGRRGSGPPLACPGGAW